MGITTRQTISPGVYNKATPLSNNEIDQNFIYLYNGNLRTINIIEPNPLDKRYGPYETVLDALSEIPRSRRYRGLRVGIIQNETSLKEYWFEHGIEDADLIPCNTTLEVTNLSVINPISGSITGNSGSSNSLNIPRKISISGDASGYAYFDGSSDISIPIVLTGGLSLQFENIANKPTTISGYGITDAYTKAEVDNLATGISIKQSVRIGTTGNITLFGTQRIDGVNLVSGDRVLVKNQTNKTQNGIYVVSSGTWTRSIDADENVEVKSGLYCLITSGSTQSNTGWILTTPNPITLGTTELTFVQFNGLGQVTTGTGLVKDGTTISLDLSGVTPGTYNNSTTSITPFTIDEHGRVTLTGTPVTIQPSWVSIQSKPTTLSGYGITDAASLSHNHTLDSLSNVTIVGNTSGEILKWTGTLWTNNTLDEAGIAKLGHNHDSSDITDATHIANPNTIVKRDSSGNFSANIITASLTGNASTASKLSSSKTIELSGDVTGSVSFDGSSNINIVSTVVNNSHNHLFSNITNTPTTLSGYGIIDAQPLDGNLTSISGLTGTSGLLRKISENMWSLDTNTYLTSNQTITFSGDVTGSGTTLISLSLANSGVTPGTYNNSSTSITPLIIDSKGRINSVDNPVIIKPEWSSIQTKPTTLSGYGITDSYTKTEVDNLLSGLDTKQSVRVTTTENINLSGIQTIDGVLLVAGNRVLVKNQDDPRQNGIYDVDSSSWIRSTDADSSSKVTSGLYCFVEEGLTQADSGWILITNDPINLGSSSLTFTQFNGLGQVTTGQGLEKNGNIISITNSGITPGTYNNSSSSITPITIDVMGRVTSVGANVTIKPEWSSIQTKPTTLSGYGIIDGALSNHIHGNITNDGKIGTTANLPLITTNDGLITTGSFGTSANTFCQGNDSRLSDARIPLDHNHVSSDITDATNESNGNTIVKRDSLGNFSANTITAALSGNASTASKLTSAVTINDTSFDGSSNITTSSWGASRTITIGSTGKTINGSQNVSWSLSEIGASSLNHNHTSIDITDITTAGRNLITAIDINQQRTLLNIANAFPFYNTLGIHTPILLQGDFKLPFFQTNGIQNNIQMVTSL
jgi:phage-related tail fiber protein